MAAEEHFPSIIETLTAKSPQLKPRVSLKRLNDRVPPEYAITEVSHPELVAVLDSMLAKAGIQSRYNLVLLGDGFGGAGVDFDRQMIGLGDRLFSKLSFEEITHVIGHEIGHIWRKDFPSVKGPAPEGYTFLSPPKLEEIEADLIGACLSQKEAAITRLQNAVPSKDTNETHPAISSRIAALKDFDMSRCGEWIEWNPADTPEVPHYGKIFADPNKTR